MVNVVTIAAYRWIYWLKKMLGPKVGGHLALLVAFVRWTGWTLALAVHCYDDISINIVVAITITPVLTIKKSWVLTPSWLKWLLLGWLAICGQVNHLGI